MTKLDDDDHDGEEDDDDNDGEEDDDDHDDEEDDDDATIVICNVRSSSCPPGQSSLAQGAQEREGVNILLGEPVSPNFFQESF